eukprot:m.196037 g.196037  ORF g.196037 m.196037 type:complete len:265 (+) comp19678_c0_seq1:210-1004(+)
MTDQVLKGKRALVTGSTSGIGLGVLQSLAQAGCAVIMHGLGDQDEIDARVAELKQAHPGVPITYVPGDLSTTDGVVEMMRAAGDVDILVNNAGIQFVSPVEDFPLAQWDKVLTVNLTAPFLISQTILPTMYTKKWGRLIHIASAHGKVASVNKAAYVAAKHGLVGLSKVIALEAASHHDASITSNCICPGWVLTPLVLKQIEARAATSGRTVEEEKMALCGEKHPTCRFTTPEQIGSAVVFFCSEGGANVTGTELSMDGGWTAQ